MKKLLLIAGAYFLTAGLADAQVPGWMTTGAYDNFDSLDFVKNGANSEGVVWFADDVFTMERLGDGVMTLSTDSAGGAGAYPLFGVNFNDSNDDGTGTPFTVDLSDGADIKLEIENTSSQTLLVDIKLVDANDVQSEVEPNVSDVTSGSTWADPVRKALNGFTLAAGTKETITIDLSSVPGLIGGYSIASYDNCDDGPFYCPEVSYDIDITKIKSVLFRVNFGGNNIDLSEGDGDYTKETFISGPSIVAFKGDIKIHSFGIGSGIATGIQEAVIDNSLSVYPNPAKDQLTVSFEAQSSTTVSISDVLGNEVYRSKASSGSTTTHINTSQLANGIYMLNIATNNGMVSRKLIVE